MAGERVGRVEQIWVYPVRSLAGAEVPDVEVTARGLAGDRAWTVVGDDDRPVRAKDVPGLAGVPGAGDREAVAREVGELTGRAVRVVRAPGQDDGVAPVHLVSRAAIERAAGGDVPAGCSADDPRANLVLTLDGDERAWVGRELRVGEAVLHLTRTPKHCLGVYADVRTPGRVAVGDPVLL
ncbi:MAG TPA: MOSC N-terminal beta barrel domain-containing protein [Blastococcus sp.]|nr:MOSC N-terminal beta barrel domain-containing protein [Blastococcus sp.]